MSASRMPRPEIDLDQAQQYLSMFAGDNPVTFQTFDDNKSRSGRPGRKFHGTLAHYSDTLQQLNAQGDGVFVTVNETDLKGRSIENIIKVRALFLDLDGAPIAPVIDQALKGRVIPHLTVQSSGDGDHVFWLVKDCAPDQFGRLQKALAQRFDGDVKVVDLPRVMRLPGFIWRKVDKYGQPEGEPFQSRIASMLDPGDQPPYTVDEIVNGLGLVLDQNKPASVTRGKGNGKASRLSRSSLREPAKDHWREILAEADIDASYLDGKHHPCPGCGGTDRFRFDNLGGYGTFICGGGGEKTMAGDGFSLLHHVHGWHLSQSEPRIDLVLNGDPQERIKDALEAAQDDPGAMFEESVLRALHSLTQTDRAEYQRVRFSAKKTPGVNITNLEKAIAEVHEVDGGEEANQLEYAQQAIVSFGSGNLIHAQSSFWQWNYTGVWREAESNLVKQSIHKVMPNGDITGTVVDSVLKLVATESFKPRLNLGGAFEGINSLNGELHFEAGAWTLKHHDKERYLITQVPVAYDPAAKAPRFTRFLDEIFDGDPDHLEKKRLVLELAGYTLLSTCRYEKFAILIGSGANGKSVLLEVIKALCGADNVAAVQPEQMGSAFQRAYLHGKLANLVTEIAEGAVINDAALKAIASGEFMTAERKYRDPFSFGPFATCWFGTNHMPHTRDFSDALFRRACILSFNNKFEGENCDSSLKGALLNELPGILNMALHAIGCVIQVGSFTEPASSVDARATWRTEADQVRQFVDECCQLGGGEELKGELYQAYRTWCVDAGVNKPVKQRSFLNRLKMIGTDERRTGAGRYCTGISLVNRPSVPGAS